jgi:hypothetical protein
MPPCVLGQVGIFGGPAHLCGPRGIKAGFLVGPVRTYTNPMRLQRPLKQSGITKGGPVPSYMRMDQRVREPSWTFGETRFRMGWRMSSGLDGWRVPEVRKYAGVKGLQGV